MTWKTLTSVTKKTIFLLQICPYSSQDFKRHREPENVEHSIIKSRDRKENESGRIKSSHLHISKNYLEYLFSLLRIKKGKGTTQGLLNYCINVKMNLIITLIASMGSVVLLMKMKPKKYSLIRNCLHTLPKMKNQVFYGNSSGRRPTLIKEY